MNLKSFYEETSMFNISYLPSFFLLIFLPFSNAVAITVAPIECIVTKTIAENQWAQIGIPCEAPADQNTVADIFSDDISGTYGTDWVLFSYNPTTNSYEKPALTDTVEVGKGYWVISTNLPFTLDMPQGSQPVSVQNSTQCLFTEGCYETTVVANPGNVQYQMLSSPIDISIVAENLRINSGLETGLTLEEAEADDIFSHQLWHYNDAALAYDEIQNQIISPWTGFWVATLPTASNSPASKLLFPSSLAPLTREQLIAMLENGEDVTQVNTSQITDMSDLFSNAPAEFNQDISNWDVSNVTNMSHMFENATSFNQNISNWNVSNVTEMEGMFFIAISFNQDLSNWNVSNVTEMGGMFFNATSFNQSLSNWDVSNVNNMQYMFYGATSFNQDLSNWNVSNVNFMYFMFYNATSFNQNLSNWNVSNVNNMEYMFYGATSFNQDLSNWNVSNVYSMQSMFEGATNFTNQNLSGWDVSSVIQHENFFLGTGSGNIEPIWPITREELITMIENEEDVTQVNISQIIDMGGLFSNAPEFNQDISNWDVSNVQYMYSMFDGATSFNQDISNWDVSNVYGMDRMFTEATSFNQDLSNWDVSNVDYMNYMFSGATSFNQNLSNWNVSNVFDMQFMFEGATNFTNQDLSGWDVSNVGIHDGFFVGAGSGNIEPIWNP